MVVDAFRSMIASAFAVNWSGLLPGNAQKGWIIVLSQNGPLVSCQTPPSWQIFSNRKLGFSLSVFTYANHPGFFARLAFFECHARSPHFKRIYRLHANPLRSQIRDLRLDTGEASAGCQLKFTQTLSRLALGGEPRLRPRPSHCL